MAVKVPGLPHAAHHLRHQTDAVADRLSLKYRIVYARTVIRVI